MNKFKSIKIESLYNFSYTEFWNKIKKNLIKIWIFHTGFVIGILFNILAALILATIIIQINTINLYIALPLYIIFKLIFILTTIFQIWYQSNEIKQKQYTDEPIKFFFNIEMLQKKSKIGLILSIIGIFIPFICSIFGYLIFMVPLQQKCQLFLQHKYYKAYISYYEKKQSKQQNI
ncbi:hypothetical protein [Mycoplasmoides pirum]|uniref:hypothetical protein n=1 Tax=Mycoplasmoides pirum TaxID=2122 RepID=UPI00055DD68C|nr:hypothetical protein [Mycoplasmoides pirum]